jgi:hypothetical protein
MSPDSVVSEPFYSQSFNRYTYVDNRPLSLIDPSGYGAQEIVITAWIEAPPGGSNFFFNFYTYGGSAEFGSDGGATTPSDPDLWHSNAREIANGNELWLISIPVQVKVTGSLIPQTITYSVSIRESVVARNSSGQNTYTYQIYLIAEKSGKSETGRPSPGHVFLGFVETDSKGNKTLVAVGGFWPNSPAGDLSSYTQVLGTDPGKLNMQTELLLFDRAVNQHNPNFDFAIFNVDESTFYKAMSDIQHFPDRYYYNLESQSCVQAAIRVLLDNGVGSRVTRGFFRGLLLSPIPAMPDAVYLGIYWGIVG